MKAKNWTQTFGKMKSNNLEKEEVASWNANKALTMKSKNWTWNSEKGWQQTKTKTGPWPARGLLKDETKIAHVSSRSQSRDKTSLNERIDQMRLERNSAYFSSELSFPATGVGDLFLSQISAQDDVFHKSWQLKLYTRVKRRRNTLELLRKTWKLVMQLDWQSTVILSLPAAKVTTFCSKLSPSCGGEWYRLKRKSRTSRLVATAIALFEPRNVFTTQLC